MMNGFIMLWAGAIIDIPAGWAICDGNNGTPDLRDKFIVGAGTSYAVGATGGLLNHNHSLQSGAGVATGPNLSTTTTNQDSRPPYYALAYVMKL